MAREISTGINDIVKHINNRNIEQSHKQWRDLRNKIDSLLLSSNVIKSDDARKLCLDLDNLNPAQREEHINKHWGAHYTGRVAPLLHQLKILEASLANTTSEQTPNVVDP